MRWWSTNSDKVDIEEKIDGMNRRQDKTGEGSDSGGSDRVDNGDEL